MIKIIEGKRYDSERSEEIVFSSNPAAHSRSDHSYWEETLFRSKKGAWFVVGFGGPASRYAEATGENSWVGSTDLRPLAEEEAYDWLEENKHWEEAERFFPHRIKDA
jgi:hypothetical protein